MAYYNLDKHCYFCKVDSRYLFLVLNKDLYISLDQTESTDFEKRFIQRSPSNQQPDDFLQSLVEKDILYVSDTQRHTVTPLFGKTAKKDLIGFRINVQPEINALHVLRFFNASLCTWIRLKLFPLKWQILWFEVKKKLFAKHAKRKESLQDLVEINNLLRPFLFTAKNRCLYESMVLMDFLSYYGFYPNLVIGVKMGPFSAHCWLQDQDTVLNDSVTHTSWHTPILII